MRPGPIQGTADGSRTHTGESKNASEATVGRTRAGANPEAIGGHISSSSPPQTKLQGKLV